MARWISGIGNRAFVLTEATAIDLTATAGDVETGMICPQDGAHVAHVTYTIMTAGTGSGANHELILEHGLGAAGAALTGQVDVDADAVAGVITEGDGLAYASQPTTVRGTMIQILNAESASITTGAILDIVVLWEL